MVSLLPCILISAFVLSVPTLCLGWSTDGHSIICNLARPLFTQVTSSSVNNLLQAYGKQNFTTLCTWGSDVEYLPQYSWSPPLHYINTPDTSCSYSYQRDCLGMFGQPDMCASGAINNYTSQLVNNSPGYNHTEALLFLSNIMGDIHQPLRVGFAGDEGGQTIRVHWLNTLNGSSSNLFQIWDSVIIHEAEERYYNASTPTFNETVVDIVGNMSYAIYQNLTVEDISLWSPCPGGAVTCPDLYASESIQLACQWAYADITSGSVLPESYFATRLPVVEQRLLQAGVRLAATLNRIFDPAQTPPAAPPVPVSAPVPAGPPAPVVVPSAPVLAPAVVPVAPAPL